MTISSGTGIWTVGANWPWPQAFFTSYYNLVVAIKADNDVSLYELTNAANTWTATERVVIGTKATIVSVDVADFINYYIIAVELTTGKRLFAKNPSTGAVAEIASSTIPVGNTCCNYLGQFLVGGITSTAAPWTSLSPCIVVWSEIGSTGIDPEDYVSAGFAPMPWDENNNGKVYRILPLGNSVRVYGDRGITNLKPYTVGKTTGFGVDVVERPGILSKDAIDGDETVHGYIDNNYNWNIATRKKRANTGYSQYLKTMTGRIIVRYDSSKKKFYISNGTYSFVFNKFGMYSTNQCATSVCNFNNIQCGFYKDNADTKIRLATTPFDVGSQGLQTIEAVELGLTYDTTTDAIIYGAMSTKYGYNTDFLQLGWMQLNPQRVFTQKVTGNDFKIHMQSDYVTSGSFSLNSLTAKVKFSDKRNLRGRINAN